MVEKVIKALAHMVSDTAKALKLHHVRIEYYSDEWGADVGRPPLYAWWVDEKNNCRSYKGGNDE